MDIREIIQSFLWVIGEGLGGFPAAVIKDGVKIKRTPWQEGWNACEERCMNSIIELGEFLAKLPQEKLDKIIELRAHELIIFNFIEQQDGKQEIELSVLCSDFFYLACADMEDVTLEEVDELYAYFKEKKVDLWLCTHRRKLPDKYIIDEMKKNGNWTEEWVEFENSLKEKD